MSLTYGALFVGYGGLEQGVQSVLGGDTAWYAENESAPSKIMAHHHPDVPNLGDVTKVDWHTVEPVDVITGGTPCQDLSHAGKRAGMTAGTRSNLWVQMREAIAVLRPRLVVWENVRGAYSACADSELGRCPRCVGDDPTGRHTPYLRAIGRVLGDLSELGYDTWWRGLRASDVGACHGRFRVFIVATPADAGGQRWDGRADLVRDGRGPHIGRQASGDIGDGGRAHPLTLLPTPRTSDTNGAGAHGDGGLDLRTVTALLPTPTTRDHKGANQRGDDTCLTGALLPTPRATDGTKGGPNQRGSSGDLMLPSAVQHLLPTPTAVDYKASGSRGYGGNQSSTLTDATVRNPQDWSVYEAAIRRHERALGRPAPSPTEAGPKGGQRLSPRFVEWMMMLPEGHVTDVPGLIRNNMLKALGNGVVPVQAAAATRAFITDSARGPVA